MQQQDVHADREMAEQRKFTAWGVRPDTRSHQFSGGEHYILWLKLLDILDSSFYASRHKRRSGKKGAAFPVLPRNTVIMCPFLRSSQAVPGGMAVSVLVISIVAIRLAFQRFERAIGLDETFIIVMTALLNAAKRRERVDGNCRIILQLGKHAFISNIYKDATNVDPQVGGPAIMTFLRSVPAYRIAKASRSAGPRYATFRKGGRVGIELPVLGPEPEP